MEVETWKSVANRNGKNLTRQRKDREDRADYFRLGNSDILLSGFGQSWSVRLWCAVGRNFSVNVYLLRIDDRIIPHMGGRWR